MAGVDRRTRERVFERDGGLCAACGTPYELTIQHRVNRGMGGSKNHDDLASLLTLCAGHNVRLESDAEWAERGRELGYKVHRNRLDRAEDIPVWYAPEQAWFYLDDTGSRLRTHEQEGPAPAGPFA